MATLLKKKVQPKTKANVTAKKRVTTKKNVKPKIAATPTKKRESKKKGKDKTLEIPEYIKEAIICGPVPVIRDWESLPKEELTTGEKILYFAKHHLRFPEGKMMGKPLLLDTFQQAFILASFDSPTHISKSILCMARRGGKTLIIAVICLAFILTPLGKRNTLVRSAAMSREQAGLLWRLMDLICRISPDLEGLYKSIPSTKKIVGLNLNVEYQALSRQAKSGHGQAVYILAIDEAGQIEAGNDEYLDMLFSSMGTYDDSRTFIISTQAPTDSAFLSVQIDSSERDKPNDVVTHLYTAKTDDLNDEKNWYQANPSLYGGYRSIEDIKRNADEAKRIPDKQSGFLNLFMNRRVTRETLWLAPTVWAANSSPPNEDLFKEKGVTIGLDLSKKKDLTVAMLAAKDDDGFIHVKPYAFTPLVGLEQRSRMDRVPYDVWVREGHLQAADGVTIDYEWVAKFLKINIEDKGITINSIIYDRWRIEEFKKCCERVGLGCYNFKECGQGYQSMSPRVEALETVLLQEKIKHGSHPVMNLGASQAVLQTDPAGNRKLSKEKETQKIDAIVALVMAVYPLVARTDDDYGEDLSWMIG